MHSDTYTYLQGLEHPSDRQLPPPKKLSKSQIPGTIRLRISRLLEERHPALFDQLLREAVTMDDYQRLG